MNKYEKGRKQRERVFKFLEEYIHKNGYAPSFTEMERELGIVRSHVNYVLGQLDDIGRIVWKRGVPRGIALPARHASTAGYMAPIVGTISAGTGIVVPDSDFSLYDWESQIGVPPALIPKGVDRNMICALRVEGYSMREDGVLDGDLVIGQVTDRWNPRDMVAAWLEEEKAATLKRIEETDRRNVRLTPANPAFLPRIFEKDKVLVQARIFAVFHRYWE